MKESLKPETQKAERFPSEDRKVFKLGIIVLVSTIGLQINRIIAGYANLPSLYLRLLFTFLNQVVFMGLIPLALYRLMISKDPLQMVLDCKLDPRLGGKIYFLFVVIGILFSIFAILPGAISNLVLVNIGYERSHSAGTLYTHDWILAVEILLVAIIPAFFEEFIDRGMLLGALRNFDTTTQVILCGLFFGLAHQNVAQFFPAAVAGAIIGYAAIITRSIWPGIIMHFCNNFTVVMIEYVRQKLPSSPDPSQISQSAGSQIAWIMLLPLAAGALMLWLLRRVRKIHMPEVMLGEIRKKVNEGRDDEPDRVIELYDPGDGALLSYKGEIYKVKTHEQIDMGNAPEMTRVLEHMRQVTKISSKFEKVEYEKIKVKIWEYAPLIASAATALFVTIATLIWGTR